MHSLTANDIKTRGVAAIEAQLATRPEVVISVRGQDRFVVMGMAHYHYLRECELDAALAQSEADMAAGRYVVESVPQHMARLDAMLAADATPPPIASAVAKAGRRKPAAKVPKKSVRRAPAR